jgi:threonine dehydrogenase-like Zn-dependent dehydrogenase
MNVYRGSAPQWQQHQAAGSTLFGHGEPEWSYPLIYGYANVGTIEEVGHRVVGLCPGDVVFSYRPHCSWVTAPANEVVPLPVLPDLRRGVFLANLNTALNGLLDAHPSIGDVVVISGLGVIGLLLTRLARRCGVAQVIGIDRMARRRELALDAGADVTFQPSEPVAELIRERTSGRGADLVIEASGAAPALNEAIRMVGFGGLVVTLSWYRGTFEGLNLSSEFHHNRIRIKSSQVGAINPDLGPLWSTDRRMELALELITQLPLEQYVTHEYPPEQASQAYSALDALDETVVQCVFAYPESQ